MNSTSNLSARRRWMASEKIAIGVLEELGYKIIETSKRIEINGVEVGEVDVVASDQQGEIYAVEVKAGRIDVSGIRQAYVNALLINAKPLVVCKGFADDAARELAEHLGVRVIQLSDVFLVASRLGVLCVAMEYSVMPIRDIVLISNVNTMTSTAKAMYRTTLWFIVSNPLLHSMGWDGFSTFITMINFRVIQ